MNQINFKNRNISVISVILETLDLEELAFELREKLKQSPQGFFASQAVVADLNKLPRPGREALLNIQRLFQMNHLNLVGVEHRDLKPQDLIGTNLNLIRSLGDKTVKNGPGNALSTNLKRGELLNQTKIVEKTVRGGRDEVAENGDLLIIGSVNESAIAKAAGSVYIFGTLRGGAIAGASGNKNCVIYCRDLSAEFIAIGDKYLERRYLQEFSDKHKYIFVDGFFRLNDQDQMEFLDPRKQLKITLN